MYKEKLLQDIKNDLPNAPLEIIESWFLPFAVERGWPPSKDNTWRFIKRVSTDFNKFRELKWELKMLELNPEMLDKDNLKTVIDIFRSHVLKETTMYSIMVQDGADRFSSCCDYLKEHGIFPKPIALEEDSDGKLHILDGSHRLGSFFYLYGYFNINDDKIPCLKVNTAQPVWIAKATVHKN